MVLTIITRHHPSNIIKHTPRQRRRRSMLYGRTRHLTLRTVTRTRHRSQRSSLLHASKSVLHVSPLRRNATRDKYHPSNTKSLPMVRVLRVNRNTRPLSSLTVIRGFILHSLLLQTSRNTLCRIRRNNFMLLVMILTKSRMLLRPRRSFIHLFINNRPTRIRQHQTRVVLTRLIRIFRLFLIPNKKGRTIITIPIRTPLLKRGVQRSITTKSSIRSITLTPTLFRTTINIIIIIMILLRIKMILQTRNRQHHGNMSGSVLPFRSKRLPISPNNRGIHRRHATTMTTRPRLSSTRLSPLLDYHRVILRVNGRLVRQSSRTTINITHTNIRVTRPLTTMTTTTRSRHRSNNTLPIRNSNLTNHKPTRRITHPTRVSVVVTMFRITRTRLNVNYIRTILTTRIPINPMFHVTNPYVRDDHRRTRHHRHRLIIMLSKNIHGGAITMMVFILSIRLTRLTTRKRYVVTYQSYPTRHLTFYHYLDPKRYRPKHGDYATGRHFARVASFRNLSPLLLSVGL